MNFLANDSKNWMMKGNLLAELGHFKESAECYASALASDPDNPEALLNLGNLYIKFDRHSEAILCYNRILTTDSKNSVAWQQKGFALLQLNKPEEAIACFDFSIQNDPNNVNTLFLLGSTLMEHGEINEAILCYEKCLKNSESDYYFNAVWKKGLDLDRLGRKNEAIECFAIAELGFTGYPFFDNSQKYCGICFEQAIDYSNNDAFTSEFDLANQSNEIENEDWYYDEPDDESSSEIDPDLLCPAIGGLCPVEDFPSQSCPFGNCIYLEDEGDDSDDNSSNETNCGDSSSFNDNIYPQTNPNDNFKIF